MTLFAADPSPAPSRSTLTPAQQRAVDHRGGSLIVLAGPGTGKTRVIIHRIASLIDEGVEPEKIVAVTFTVKAAAQMRARLAALLGGAGVGGELLAARVNVHTFHGLGLRIVNRFPDLVGLPGPVELLDVPQSRAILRDLITSMKILPESAGAGRESILALAEEFNERLWNEGLEPAEVMQHALAWDSLLTEREREARGESSSDPAAIEAREALDAERFQQRRVVELARLAIAAQQEFVARGFCAFGDMITMPIRLLSKHAGAAALIRQDYKHFVVDEFQDVNPAQIKLLTLLCPPDHHPDLCVVGDDDQAIYGFRGSDDRAMQGFAARYPRHEQIALEENFRSRSCIVQVASTIMEGASERFSEGKTLRAAGPLAHAPGAPVRHIKTTSDTGDGPVLAAVLAEMHRAQPDTPWSKYAVIARTNGDLDRIALALALERIPAQRRDRHWQDDEGVRDVLAWAELLVNERDMPAATRLLVRPPFSLAVEDVARLLQEYRSVASRFANETEGASDPGAIASWLQTHQPENPVVRQFAELYARLRALCTSTAADEMVVRIVEGAQVLTADLLDAGDRAERVQRLVQLIRLARAKQRRLPAPGDLAAFLQYFRDLPKSDELDPSERVDASEGDTGEGEGGASDGVQLLTAHAAKGLEFDTVLVPRVAPQHGYPRTKVDEPGVVLPPSLRDETDTRSAKDRQLAEERRVFYVACTRAERALVLSGKWAKSKSSSLNFTDELVRLRQPALASDVLISQDESEVLAGAQPASAGPLALAHPGAMLSASDHERWAGLRAIVRTRAAAALDRVDHPGASASDLDAAADELARAAATLAALGHARAEPGAAIPAPLLERAGADNAAWVREQVAALAPPPAGDEPDPAAAKPKVGSSRVDLQACKLEYSIVSPK